jgi:peptidoglycan/LPS O-acetylase OafA/YrhL
MSIKKEKDQSVESLRGLAIILIVIGHVIGSRADGGMKVADDSFLRHFYQLFECLQLPLFTVIAGWVYALRPPKVKDLKSFIGKKVLRILLPMLFVGATYFLLQYFTPGTNKKGDLTEIWRLLVFPYTLYWYLQAIFLVYIVVALIDARGLLNSIRNWAVFLGISLLLLFFRDYFIPEGSPNYFCYQGVIYLLPFFIIGMGILRFSTLFLNKSFTIILCIILFIGLIIQQLTWYNILEYDLTMGSAVGLMIGLPMPILFFRIRRNVKWLIWFGTYSYSIFLFHAFGTAGGRILTNKAGIQDVVSVFMISLILGLFVPVLVEKVLDRFGITRMLFLGRSYKKGTKGD